ncbi:MAG TPA: SRPBCC family protein [Thermoanaerobaculia bacterium]|nr:SRPBCC family protein [Thermoanaerobaculia bacterium]
MRTRAREESIEIAADPESVFDLIHDYKRRLEWDPFLKEARLLDRDSACLGATCRCTAKNSFGGMAMDAIYVSFDRPNVAAVKMVRGPRILESFAATLRQEPIAGNQTRVIYRYNFETKPTFLRFILNPICSLFFASEVRNRLKRLKSFLEEASPPAARRPPPAPTAASRK